MKIIKFDLPINGIKAKNLEELRDNITDEIVGLARSGQLARWLTSRQLEDKAKAVAAVLSGAPEDKALFLALCGILEVEIHPDDVDAIFYVPPKSSKYIEETDEKNIAATNIVATNNSEVIEKLTKVYSVAKDNIKNMSNEELALKGLLVTGALALAALNSVISPKK